MPSLFLALVLLSPARLYYQPDQPVPIKFVTPDAKEAAKHVPAPIAKLLLLDPANKLIAEAPRGEAKDEVDLAKAFPQIWDGKTYYVQGATENATPIGAPLVVVPLWPPSAELRAVIKQERHGVPMGLRIYVEQQAVLHTAEGDITIGFTPDKAPYTVKNFCDLVAGGLYTNVPFHRVIPGFVIQGGDPTGTGMGGPGHAIHLESSDKIHTVGTLSMARSQSPDSAGSQFFICLSREGCKSLDKGYAAFGDVVSGMEAVNKIAATPIADEQSGRPANPPLIKSAELVPAPTRVPAK
jgi:cyclophilin family peptidyl-prolyl cis-trans isomerase